ncbi:MAG: hypothetical protein NT150_06115 [Bacteroidetes bacterium]|nr:hypothetical protein [Bacteroidota bacterium]
MKSKFICFVLMLSGLAQLNAQDSTISINLPSAHRIGMFSLSYKTGMYSNGYGFTYYRFPKADVKGWYFPLSLSVENISVKSGNFSQLNFLTSPLNFFMPGISACRNISDNFWINLGLQIPLSTEQLSDVYGKTITHPIIGLAPIQELFIIPKSTYGIIFGIGIYERISNSFIYQNDVGIRAELGLKF